MRERGIRYRAEAGERGFSLLELTVAMGLTLLMVAMISILFDQMYYLSDSGSAIADTDQNVRSSLNAVVRDLKNCGYGIPTGGIPIPGGTGSSAVWRPGPLPVSAAIAFPYSGSAANTLDVITPGAGLGPTISSSASTENNFGTAPLASDIVTTVQVDITSTINQFALTAVTPTQITLNTGSPVGSGTSQVNVNDFIMLTNSVGSALGMVTAIDTTANTVTFAAGDPLNMNQPGAAFGTIASLQGGTGTYPPTYAYKLRFLTYYLNNSDPTKPTLMRQVNNSPATPVASYITAFNVTYDLSDGVTNNQRTTTTPEKIRKVNIMVSGRSTRPLRKTGQPFVNTLTTSMNPHNLTYRNKYQ